MDALLAVALTYLYIIHGDTHSLACMFFHTVSAVFWFSLKCILSYFNAYCISDTPCAVGS